MELWQNWVNMLLLSMSLSSIISCAPTAEMSTSLETEKDAEKSSVSRAEPSTSAREKEITGAALEEDPIVCEWYAETGSRLQKKCA